ncbi:unnamed protein product [Coregonus sp. 'balchen']|nr:unnamed protein product [Coregonus sp. 'balchen']
MDILKFQLVIVTLYTLVFTCQGLSFSVDKEHWVSKDWQDEGREVSLEERLASQVASMIKRSKAHQFYGLMGKRSDVQQQPIRVDRRQSFTRIIPDAPSTAIDVAEGSDTQPVATVADEAQVREGPLWGAHLLLHLGQQRRRLGRWERSLSESLRAGSLATFSSWEALGLEMSSSDSDDGALPVGVNGGDSSWSPTRFTSGVSTLACGRNGTTLSYTDNVGYNNGIF